MAEFPRLPLVVGLIGLFKKGSLVEKKIFLGIKKKSVFDRPFCRVATKKVFQV
jgi:hypothetical protein